MLTALFHRYFKRGDAPLRAYAAVGGAVILLAAGILLLMGREPICKCGEVWLWSGDVVSSNQSQHILDPYSVTHLHHGIGFYAVTKLVAGVLPLPARAVLAVALESGWEVLENTDYVINKYREETLSRDYYGDSVVNSVADIIVSFAGFMLAARLRVRWTILFFVVLELLLLFWIHDNLTINIIMLLYPIPALKAWQVGGG